MKEILFAAVASLLLPQQHSKTNITMAGQMPSITVDNSNNVHLVYGTGDSLMYSISVNGGNSFEEPSLIAVLPGLAASHTRGPQVAVSSAGLVVTACNDSGNIFSYRKSGSQPWQKAGRVNDKDTVAKENLMALAADGDNAYAVWLDLRDGFNEIYGAASNDGGATWSANKLVYASPDSTVCECCKPTVAIQGSHVYVMFRNWLKGNRDLYLIQSADAGKSFGQAQKLGKRSWPLNGCPMDGGGLVVDKNGNPETVWMREGKIFTCGPGKPEKEMGRGRSCSIANADGKNIYAWIENGEVVLVNAQGIRKNLGKGQTPVIRILKHGDVICVWEHEKQIHSLLLQNFANLS